MFTRESALEYSATTIHRLVGECSRTGLTRKGLCERIGLSSEALAMWITGSRPCQQYWVLRNAELLLDELKQRPDKFFINK